MFSCSALLTLHCVSIVSVTEKPSAALCYSNARGALEQPPAACSTGEGLRPDPYENHKEARSRQRFQGRVLHCLGGSSWLVNPDHARLVFSM